MNTKCCSKCKTEKPLVEFHKASKEKGGVRYNCKRCTNERQKKYRKSEAGQKSQLSYRQKEQTQEYQRAYQKKYQKKYQASYKQAEKNKLRQAKHLKKYLKKWTAANPVKVTAKNKVAYAVSSGKLVKSSHCSSCRAKSCTPNELHGHHDDYALPLVVRWLCPACHMRWHRENGPGLNGGDASHQGAK
jgi:hypothetical protein